MISANRNKKLHIKIDYLLLIVILCLTILGLLFVFSASFYTAEKQTGNKYFYLNKQFVGCLTGIVGFVLGYCASVKFLKKIALPITIAAIIMLAMVFLPVIGIENYGAKRWIGIGGFTFQPSEIAKFALVLFCAWYASREKTDMKKFVHILPLLIVGGIMCVLIILEPNMSITICVGLILLILLFLCEIKTKHFVMLFLPALVAVPLLIFSEPYRVQRLLAFLDPWASPKEEGYQLIQSLYALGSGGWFGVGLLNSRQKYSFLPFAESDFVFSIIGEETGLFGCFSILVLFVLLIFCGIKIAMSANDRFDCILAGGITSVIAVQSTINFAVVTGLIPPTGLPLPFVSFGGTSLAVFLTAAGLLSGINRRSKSFISTLSHYR